MSVFFKLDVRTKLFFVILFSILVFIVDKLHVAVSLLLITIIIRLIAKIPLKGFRLLKNLTLLAFFILIIQSVFGPGDSYIVNFIKIDGLILGIVIICRIVVLLLFLPVFTETTPPHRIAAGLCALGLSYRFTFIITIAFNFIYIFKDEALIFIDAQKLRGTRVFDRETRGIFKISILKKIKAYTGLLVPLMLSAMRKAQVSSIIMDCRAFGIYKTRTWIDKPVLKKIDFYFMALCAGFFIIMIFYNYR
ncbi:MAG: energy-coupling factor transporter transmembrane protein EcfT [Treponema sp.]|nr:energy-coupling factor transporter transmembrane protein EcfT [Treponema sp.]